MPPEKPKEFQQCAECGDADKEFHAQHPDPRVAPLELDDCLCFGCFESATEERIDELQFEIDELKAAVKKAKKSRLTN